MSVTIWHNPRCSKSRETLALIEARGVTPQIIRYLEEPPSAQAILAAARQLGLSSVREMIRSKETEYIALNLDNPDLSERALADALNAAPALIERPIVFSRGKAAIGRPPENVLSIL
ncbi:MAG: arsenate reductase (glutaredoxin) [Parvularculaceae bacterium]|nr:arsenate reductase (glutaredoxin) [Parvularculaceae bacterium]